MKGPTLQYELRIYREWCCPGCGRVVRTRGNVTSRSCLCTSPPQFMNLKEPAAAAPFDASAFATYLTEEFTTPTPEELVEDLPPREVPVTVEADGTTTPVAPKEKLRRGKGYLRAEAPDPALFTDSGSDSDSSDSDDFAAGIEEHPLDVDRSELPVTEEAVSRKPPRKATEVTQARSVAETANPDADSQSADATVSDTSQRPRRSRRRNRRKGRNGGSEQKSSETTAGTSQHTSGSGEDAAGGSQKKVRPKKRRRRGGRRDAPKSGE
ncbi:MAG: hypothetical protein KDA89_04195 [Planctomycetaceae bacterium]|nr:hypothetical protein [Planctomycetaceae bacterium]